MHRLTELSLRSPWLTLGILLAITTGLATGVPKVEQAYGFRVVIGEDHPAIRALDSLINEFSVGYPVRIAWECGPDKPCQTVFDESSLQMADSLTRELSDSPNVTSVIGPANAPLFLPDEQGFELRRFVENGMISDDLPRLAQQALEDPFWLGDLISNNARVGVIVLQTRDNRPETELEITETINQALAPFTERGFSYHVRGDGPDNISAGEALSESTSALVPILGLVIAVILYILTRSWQQTLITITTMGVALVWTLGILGWLSWPQDGVLEVLAPLVAIVGVCDSVHILHRYAEERRENLTTTVRQALLAAAKNAGPACLATTLTSAAAFASFTASNLDTFVRFGLIVPIGIVICLVLSFSLLTVAISLLPEEAHRPANEKLTWHPLMTTIADTCSIRTTPLLVVTALLLTFFGFGWAIHLRADNNWMESLGESSQVVQSKKFVEQALGRSQSLELDVRLPPGERLEDPAILTKVAQFSDELSTIKHLGEPESVLDLIRRLNRLLHENNAEFERIGDSESANAELLELIAFDAPETLERWVSLDRSRVRISLPASETSLYEKRALFMEVNHQVSKHLADNWEVWRTGEVAIQYDWVRDVQATQLRSFPIAFGIVFALVSIFLRSWKLGLAAMVPTLLPVVVVLGAMGWLGMSLDVARAMIAAVVIGIGVDDSIHLLAYFKSRRDLGDPPRTAMNAALRHTGRAIVTTSVALALGFLTLMMSAWQTVASFGFFVALAILGALVASLFVLPALIFVFSPPDQENA